MVKECWYALFVETGQEENVKERLKYKFGDQFRIIVPKRKLRERRAGKWRTVIRALFPGYVLLHGEVGLEEYYRLKRIPGMFKLLCSGYTPAPIEDYEMEVINKLICNDDTIGFSEVLVENGQVVVVDGPLVTLEGQIASIDRRKGRAKVMLNFMGEPRMVELGVTVLQPAGIQ